MAGDKEMTVEESIRQAMGELEGGGQEDEERESAPADESHVTESEDPEPEPEPEAEESKDGTESEEAETPEPEAESETEDDSAPRFLDAEEKESFSKIPKAHRPLVENFIRRRDLAYQRYVSKVQTQATEYVQQAVAPYAPLLQVIQPHMQRMELDGKDLARAVQNTLAWDQRLDENPLDAIAQLCKRKGVHPRQVFDYLNGDGNSGEDANVQGSHDPRYGSEADGELGKLRSEIAELKEGLVGNSFKDAILQFSAARGADGQLRYPFFEDVRRQMKPLVKSFAEANPNLGLGELLTEAYNAACWSNENIRALMLQSQHQKKAAANLQKKKAATSIRTSGVSSGNGFGTKTPQGGEMTIEDSIRASAAELGIEL